MMIVQAAKKYHAPAGKGGKHFNTNVAIAAENVVNEGLRVLQTPDVAVNIAYWEGRVQVGTWQHTIRQPGHRADRFSTALTAPAQYCSLLLRLQAPVVRLKSAYAEPCAQFYALCI
jgi:hypothetical protein